jgi:hypothetical protein
VKERKKLQKLKREVRVIRVIRLSDGDACELQLPELVTGLMIFTNVHPPEFL